MIALWMETLISMEMRYSFNTLMYMMASVLICNVPTAVDRGVPQTLSAEA
jgi:hypothetical protein